MHALDRALPEGAIVVEESASNRAAFFAHVRITRPGSYFATASGGLGFAMPAAVGVRLARPDRPVACLVGDGAAMFAPQSLWTAAQLGLPVVFLVLRNGHYGILKSFAAFGGHGDRIPGLDLPGLDIVQIACGFGCAARRVERSADLADHLRGAFADAERDRVPVLLEIVVDAAVPPLLGQEARPTAGGSTT